jgi:hypothetical protein
VSTLNRKFRLRSGIVRAIIPKRRIGSYLLSDGRDVSYVGRSDRCLQQRLLNHVHSRRAQFFEYQLHDSPYNSFIAECAGYHNHDILTNKAHPAAPHLLFAVCPFCRTRTIRTRNAEIRLLKSDKSADMKFNSRQQGDIDS